MTPANDLMPFAGTVRGGFFVGLLAGYSIKKTIKIATVLVGLIIAASAYLKYLRIVQVEWDKLQFVSQSRITWVAYADHAGVSKNLIPLASRTSVILMLGLARG